MYSEVCVRSVYIYILLVYYILLYGIPYMRIIVKNRHRWRHMATLQPAGEGVYVVLSPNLEQLCKYYERCLFLKG